MSYANCSRCGHENTGNSRFCSNCGAFLEEVPRVETRPAQPVDQHTYQPPVHESLTYAPSVYSASSYASLRGIASLCSALGWLVVVACGLGASVTFVYAIQRDLWLVLLGGIVFWFALGGLGYIILRMIAEAISVFLDIEANTRQAAISSQRVVSILEHQSK